jgi:hypothetical protein
MPKFTGSVVILAIGGWICSDNIVGRAASTAVRARALMLYLSIPRMSMFCFGWQIGRTVDEV